MSNERTEKATPKRRQETREKGQTPKSADLNSSVTLTVALYLLFMLSPNIMNMLKTLSVRTFSNLDPSQISKENLAGYFSPFITEIFGILLPFFLVIMISGIVINFYQVGFMFSLEAIKPDLSKIGPTAIINKIKQLFSMRSAVELLKSFLKMAVVGGITYSIVNSRKEEVFALLGADIATSLGVISSIIFQIMTLVFIVLLVISIFDKVYQEYEFEKSIKMSKEEIKDERKNADGDPAIKAKIKNAQMKFAMQRMMSAVPKADVIVTNPTHYAIALRYDTSVAPAPQVIAKGVDFVAFKIKEIAQNNNIPIVENKPLARTLYKIVPLDGLIPADLYIAVAEVLAYVFKTNKGMR